MVMNDDVPREFDKIQIKYRMPTGELVWWPTTIISSREQEIPGYIKGMAIVEFAAYKNCPTTTEDVQFLADRVVNTNMGETPWRTSAEAADAGAGNQEEADWQPTSRARQAVGGESSTIEDVQDESEKDSEGDSTEEDPVTEQPPKQRRRLNPTAEVCDPRGPSTGADTQRRTTAPNNEPAQVMRDEFDAMVRRVVLLEESDRISRRHAKEDVYEKFVNDKKVLWLTRVLKLLGKPVKKFTPTPGRPFSAVLRSDKFTVSEDMSYFYFSHLVDDLVRQDMFNNEPSGISLHPSGDALVHPEGNIAEANVLFHSARALFMWLGMTSNEDLRNNIAKSCKQRDGVDITRVLGGLQWTDGDMAKPLRVFVGTSCVAAVPSAGGVSGPPANVVEFASAQWDMSNNTLMSRPVSRTSRRGEYTTTRAWESVFRLSWTWTGGYEGRAVSPYTKSTHNTRLGEVKLTIPYVVFRGNETCGEVRTILTEEFILGCAV